MSSLIARLLDWVRGVIWPGVDNIGEMDLRLAALEQRQAILEALLTEDQIGVYATILGMASLERAMLLIDEDGAVLFTEANPGVVGHDTLA